MLNHLPAVVVEGDVGKEFYVVISGRFKVYERATQMQTSQTAEDAQATVGHEVPNDCRDVVHMFPHHHLRLDLSTFSAKYSV